MKEIVADYLFKSGAQRDPEKITDFLNMQQMKTIWIGWYFVNA
jgi:hypothetical protein